MRHHSRQTSISRHAICLRDGFCQSSTAVLLNSLCVRIKTAVIRNTQVSQYETPTWAVLRQIITVSDSHFFWSCKNFKGLWIFGRFYCTPCCNHLSSGPINFGTFICLTPKYVRSIFGYSTARCLYVNGRIYLTKRIKCTLFLHTAIFRTNLNQNVNVKPVCCVCSP